MDSGRSGRQSESRWRGGWCDPAIKTNTAVPRGQEAALAAVNALLKTQGGTREDEGRCADRGRTLELLEILWLCLSVILHGDSLPICPKMGGAWDGILANLLAQ